MDDSYNDKEKPKLACVFDLVLNKFLNIKEWEHHIFPSWFNKFIIDTYFAKYFKSTKRIHGACWIVEDCLDKADMEIPWSILQRLCDNISLSEQENWAYKITGSNVKFFIIVVNLFIIIYIILLIICVIIYKVGSEMGWIWEDYCWYTLNPLRGNDFAMPTTYLRGNMC